MANVFGLIKIVIYLYNFRKKKYFCIFNQKLNEENTHMSKQDKAALRYLNTQCITNYTQKMRIIGTLKHDVPNLRLDNCKFITAGLRMYYNNELNDEQSIR